jgi:uncharacterized alkaline shock family protein YloU
MENELGNVGTLKISEEVIAKIAGAAVLETEGVASLSAKPQTEIKIKGLMNGRKTPVRGIKVEIIENRVIIDIAVIINFGEKIQEVSANIQDNVIKAVSTMAGLTVTCVNIVVNGINFDVNTPQDK